MTKTARAFTLIESRNVIAIDATRLSSSLREALDDAPLYAAQAGRDAVNPADVVLAVLDVGTSETARALTALGVTDKKFRKALAKQRAAQR